MWQRHAEASTLGGLQGKSAGPLVIFWLICSAKRISSSTSDLRSLQAVIKSSAIRWLITWHSTQSWCVFCHRHKGRHAGLGLGYILLPRVVFQLMTTCVHLQLTMTTHYDNWSFGAPLADPPPVITALAAETGLLVFASAQVGLTVLCEFGSCVSVAEGLLGPAYHHCTTL